MTIPCGTRTCRIVLLKDRTVPWIEVLSAPAKVTTGNAAEAKPDPVIVTAAKGDARGGSTLVILIS